jgi:hypothetical protein
MDAISASVGSRLVGLNVFTLMNRTSILLGWCFVKAAVLSNGLNRIDMKRKVFSVRTTTELQFSGIQRETARRNQCGRL